MAEWADALAAPWASMVPCDELLAAAMGAAQATENTQAERRAQGKARG